MSFPLLTSLWRRLTATLRGARAHASFSGGAEAGIFVIDQGGRIVDRSGRARGMLAAGDDLADLAASADRGALEDAIRSKVVNRLRLRTREGVLAELVFERRPDRGANVLILPALSAAADAGDRPFEALADISHEMKTPLNAVIGFAEAMSEETFGALGHPKYAEYADHIRTSGRHLLDLASSVVDLAKAGSGHRALTRVRFDLDALVRESVAMIRGPAEEAGLAVHVRVDKDLPAAFLDAMAVRQIIINLLANAVKFTSDGSICVTVSAVDGAFEIIVADTGVGMNEDDLASLGQRFTPAQGEGVRGAGGAGIGLSLAMALAELHGGAISFASRPGEGLEARVRLPILAPAAPAREPDELSVDAQGIRSQLDRVEAYRREAERRRAKAA